VVAFARQDGDNSVLVCVPRLLAGLLGPQPLPPLGTEVWADTSLPLPAGLAARRFRNLFTGETLEARSSNRTTALPVADIFANFPVALLVGD
jgi:(1->4)-alpha-D-glucan 1-alpha-D-glucosylmutase